jgi:hypothetical protein
MTEQYVPLSAVLNDLRIPSEYYNESDALEWAAIAMGKIKAHVIKEHAVTYLHVQNHKAVLPKGLLRIDMIAYRLEEPGITEEEIIQYQNSLRTSESLTFQLLSGKFFNGYRPLRLATSPFAAAIVCEDCGSLNVQGEHTYSITPNGCITTSFKEGFVCVAYTRYPKSKEGEFMIPADEDYLDAIANYIMFRHWEVRWNAMEDGARERFEYYRQKWSHLQRKATGAINMPNIDILENIRQNRNRLVPKERHYYNFFGLMSQEPRLHMGGINQEFIIGRAYNNLA